MASPKLSSFVPKPVRDLAAKAGIKLSTRCVTDDTYVWDGKTIAVRIVTARGRKVRPLSDIVHDIAHFLVAPKSRRYLPEFGLGNSPDGGKYAEPAMGYKACDDEEGKASALGILIERHLEMKWAETYNNHNWFWQSPYIDAKADLAGFFKEDGKTSPLHHDITRLIKARLLTRDLIPRVLIH